MSPKGGTKTGLDRGGEEWEENVRDQVPPQVPKGTRG